MCSRGLEVHGIDGSGEMVARLAAKPGGERIPVVIGDFADADAGGGFTLVVLAVNTIFALPDQEAQVACFRNAERHLAPSGRFVVEAWVPDVGAFRDHRQVRPRVMRPDFLSIETADLDQADQIMRTTQAVFSRGEMRLYPATPGTRGPRSWTSWASWRGSVERPAGRTGPAASSPGTAGRTSRCTAHSGRSSVRANQANQAPRRRPPRTRSCARLRVMGVSPSARMTKPELARRVGGLCRLTGQFRLRSGLVSSSYFDKYLFESDPVLLGAVAAHLVDLLPPSTEVLAGLELGGVPVATALSLETGLPVAFVRKAAKPYGTAKLPEGIDVAGRRSCWSRTW